MSNSDIIACLIETKDPKDEITKCIKDNGLCGVGGFCDVCPHVINNQDELSVEEQAALAKWPLDVMLNYLKNFSTEQAIANTVYLRRLQQMEADIAAKDKILDQHIAALTPPILGIFR